MFLIYIYVLYIIYIIYESKLNAAVRLTRHSLTDPLGSGGLHSSVVTRVILSREPYRRA